MRIRPAVLVAILLVSYVPPSQASTPVVYDTTPSPAGNAHWVATSEKTLNETQLTESLLSMLATGDHLVSISISKPQVGPPTVQLRFSTNGASPSGSWSDMTQVSSTSSTLTYRRTVTAADLGTSKHPEQTAHPQS